jgi:ABC-type bacteriocin/lantibiotic exporter with double-glycine peptidase domain
MDRHNQPEKKIIHSDSSNTNTVTLDLNGQEEKKSLRSYEQSYDSEDLEITEKLKKIVPSALTHPKTQHASSTQHEGVHKKHRRRVPVLLQMNVVECGATCLAMILGYYGRETSISEIRERYGIGRDGLLALDIARVARSYGLRVRAISLPENDFRFVSLPAIVHWEFNHFLIVERWSPHAVDVVDPASGRRRMTAREFSAGFTGVVLMLESGLRFDRHTEAPRITLRTYLIRYFKQSPTIFLQILVATFLLELFGLALPLLTSVLVNQVIPTGMTNMMSMLGIGLLIVLLAQLVITLLRETLLVYLQARIDTTLMVNFFEHLLMLPHRFFQLRSSGDILARINSNTVIRDLISNQFISTLLDGGLIIGYLAILLWLSPLFAGLTLAIGLLQVALLLLSTPLIRAFSRSELASIGKTQGYVAEMLKGMETLKAAGAEQRAFERWSNLFFGQLNISLRQEYLSATVRTFITILNTFSPMLLLWVGTIQVLDGHMQMGTMLALNMVASTFLGPLASLVSSAQQLQLAHAHLERIADVLEAETEQDVRKVQLPPQLSGQIDLEHVSFRYDEQSPHILNDISVHIQAGQKVAIVGKTGSGKSTLGKLLLGFYQPSEGEIRYDGLSLRDLNYQAVRAQFGVVMQDALIFSGSIRQNITFNQPTMSAERMVEAVQAAALQKDILGMPMGYETFVSEGGSALSGGQRQRLALARALASNPAILLLDEATSALDVETERVIERNLNQLSCTQVIIAHRLSTIRNADLILVLDQGKLVECGSHQQLLAKQSYYARLIQHQLAMSERSN